MGKKRSEMMETPAECKSCLFAQPNIEVSGVSVDDWRFPEDFECAFDHDYFPAFAYLCEDLNNG